MKHMYLRDAPEVVLLVIEYNSQGLLPTPNLQRPVSLVQRDLLGPTGGLRRTQISMHDSRVRF